MDVQKDIRFKLHDLVLTGVWLPCSVTSSSSSTMKKVAWVSISKDACGAVAIVMVLCY